MSPELEAAVRAVEASETRGLRPSRHLARPVLILIGEGLLSERPAGADDALVRLGRLSPPLRQAFAEAVRDELSMACTEHIRSVDPRYLDHPDYDFEYTVSARRRLEARLRAAERLGVLPDESVMSGVRRSDALLEAQLRARK